MNQWSVTQLSVTQLYRLYGRVYRRMEREFSGGGLFGYDWRTMNIVSPQHARSLRLILAAIDYAEAAEA